MLTIAHRFALGLLAPLVLAAPAGAAEVARSDAAELDARDRGRAALCLDLTGRGPGAPGPELGSLSTCARPPVRERRALLVTLVTGHGVTVGGAVPASVRRAEAELADGRRFPIGTVEGAAYRGRAAGRLRFFIADLPRTGRRGDEFGAHSGGLVAVRLFDADGGLRGVAAPDGFFGTEIGRRELLLRERARRDALTLRAGTQRRVASTPLALDRLEDVACLYMDEQRNGNPSGGITVCDEPGPNGPALSVFPQSGCGALRTAVFGFVGDAVTAVRLELGSGRAKQIATRIWHDAGGGAHRYVAAVVPRGEAVRSVRAVGADAAHELREPPSGLPCFETGDAFALTFLGATGEGSPPRPETGDEQVAAEAGGHRLLVRDAELDRLCLGLDALRADGSDCSLPPVNGEDATGLVEDGLVSAIVPAEVARVRLPDGREVPTVAGGYSGRYAGAVRFLLVEADGDDPRKPFRALDETGAVIGTFAVLSPELYSPTPRRRVGLAAGRGWRLDAARHVFGRCLALTLAGRDPECVGGLGRYDAAAVAVGCTPRVAVLAGSLARRTRSVRAVLRGGRTLRARILRVPKRSGGGRAWVLPLPRSARMKALRIGGRRVEFPVLPAVKQCGYLAAAPELTSFGVAEPELAVLARLP